ncbi:TSUP family transporter [Poseidonibacter ostreae]|uniref:Probable membrane transporter protein n=1 Tax=Poseidonibacter ostreae TaxID=2654171 RepID=A0A6L4WT88_9BACT|nr:TSUP family transporter [Poseidonibacter ostreae]KAB7891813.1 TSUP family transporter [Poseidonibacter ostreae]
MIIFLALGSFVGVVAGLFGIGGGGLIVPILTMFLLSHEFGGDEVVQISLATSIAVISITSISSFRAQHKKKAVRWDIFKMIAPGVIVGTFMFTFVASNINSFYLSVFFSIFMLYAAYKMFFGKKAEGEGTIIGRSGQFFAGFGIGGISALVSIGGGMLSVPYLVKQNIDMKKAIGTSSAIGFPLAISGTLGYIINGYSHTSIDTMMLGYVYVPAFVCIAFASYLTAPIGVNLSHKLPIVMLKKIFGILLLILSIKMMLELI